MHHFKAFDMINLQYEIKILEKILNKAMSKFLSPSLKHNNRDYPNMGYPLICMMQTFTGPDFTQLPGGLFSPSDIWKKLSRQHGTYNPTQIYCSFSIAQSLPRNFLLF